MKQRILLTLADEVALGNFKHKFPRFMVTEQINLEALHFSPFPKELSVQLFEELNHHMTTDLAQDFIEAMETGELEKMIDVLKNDREEEDT